MKRFLISSCCLLLLVLASQAQYTTITYGSLAVDDYSTVNRRYFTVPNPGGLMTDAEVHMQSLMEIAATMAKVASGFTPFDVPAMSGTPFTYTPDFLTDLGYAWPGGVPGPTERFRITKVHYSPEQYHNKDLRMLIVRPNDDVLRPCVMVSHGKKTDVGTWVAYLFNCAEYLMRGYVVAFYENTESVYAQVEPDLSCGSNFWPDFQKYLYYGMQYATAATKYVLGNAATHGIATDQYFASGISFGSMCTLMLAYGDGNNFNDVMFEPNANPNMNAKVYPAYQALSLPTFKAIAPIATAFPRPGANNKIGSLIDGTDNGTPAIFIHGMDDLLLRLVIPGTNTATLDYPGGCSQATVLMDNPIALGLKLDNFGIDHCGIIHCSAGHETVDLPPAATSGIFLDAFFTQLDFDIDPEANFLLGSTSDWQGMGYLMQQFSDYSNVICQRFRSRISVFAAPQPSSAPDLTDGVTTLGNGKLNVSPCGFSQSGYAFKQVLPTAPTIFPNPTAGKVLLSLAQTSPADRRVDVHNAQGTRVGRWTLPGGTGELKLDLGQFARGLYFLQVEGEAPLRVVLQ